MMERKQAVIYARVSSKEQEKEGFSIPAQLKLLHEYAIEQGFCVVKEFIDVETAKTAGRSQFGEMVKFLQANRGAKDILVEKTDRLYRNFKDYVALEDLDLVVHLVKESEVLSKDSRSHTKFIHGIKVLMAKNYIDNLSEETKKGMREKAEQGHYPSFAPLGYQNNRETKRIELDPEVAPLIRKLFEWYATGNFSLLQVRNMAREFMEAEGVAFQHAKRLTKSTVEHILKNPIYHGDFLWNGKLYHGSHPPLIAHALWEQTQEAFRRTNHPKQTKRAFPFIGMLTCTFCGCAITAEIKKGKYIYYHCTGNHGPCPRPATRQETLEEQLGEVIKGINIDEGLLDWLIEALRESHRDEKVYHDRMIASLQAQYDKLQHRIDQAYTDKLDGKIPEDLFLRKMKEWREEQSKILSQIRAHQTANHNYLEEGIRLLELANKAYFLYLRQPAHEKARLLKIVQSNCLWDGVSACPKYRKPFDILAEGLSTSKWLPGPDSNQRPSG
jgi:site-specific DNA recombinase